MAPCRVRGLGDAGLLDRASAPHAVPGDHAHVGGSGGRGARRDRPGRGPGSPAVAEEEPDDQDDDDGIGTPLIRQTVSGAVERTG